MPAETSGIRNGSCRVLVPAILTFCIVLGVCRGSSAEVWRVPADAPTIQAGIDSASAGDTVLVECGRYIEHDISMKSGVKLISRHRQPGCSIVDAEGKGRVFFCNNVDSTSLIHGFTITNGLAAGIPEEYEISYDDGSPEFALALNESFDGGAVRCTPAAYPVKIAGARVFITNVGDPFQRFRVCIYDDDGAGGAGGTILASIDTSGLGGNRWQEVDFSSKNIFIADGDFYVGVIWLTGASEDTTIYLGLDLDGEFDDRSWLIVDGGTTWDQSELHDYNPKREWMIRARVQGPPLDQSLEEMVHDFSDGAGMYCTHSQLTVSNCIISNNAAEDQGGGVFCDSSDVEIKDCILYENSAESGGGIYLADSSPSIAGCTIALNTADLDGGGVAVDGAGVEISTSIVSFNQNGGAVSCFGAGSASFTCSNIYANTDGDWSGCIAGQDTTAGNFAEDPLFCKADSGDFRIDLESPCAPANSPCGELIGAEAAVECLTPVECWGLRAESAKDAILVSWNTSPQARPMPFEVQKSGRPEGPFQTPNGEIRQTSPGRFEYLDSEVVEERDYWYRLVAKYPCNRLVLGPIRASFEEAEGLAGFSGSYPNPSHSSTHLYLEVNEPATATIRIYNSSGVLVRELETALLTPGIHTICWDGRDSAGSVVSSGVYFCRFISEGATSSAKLIIVE